MINTIKNTSNRIFHEINWVKNKLEKDEQRTLLIWNINQQKTYQKNLLLQWKMASNKDDPLNIGTDNRFQDMITSLRISGKDKPLLEDLSSYQKTAECEVWKKDEPIMIMEIVRIPLEYQSFKLLQYIPVTIAINNSLITPNIKKINVAIDNSLSKELSDEDLTSAMMLEELFTNPTSKTVYQR